MSQVGADDGRAPSGALGMAEPPGEPGPAGPSRRPLFPGYWRWVVVGVVVVLVAAVAATVVLRPRAPRTSLASIRVSGIPSNVPTSLAAEMSLQPDEGGRLSAPNFTLTDQHGTTLSLASFRGHPVVLTFMDPHCVTMCPIIAQEFIDAARVLARTDPGVVFLAVNVNRHALGVATVDAFTTEHQLNTIPTWHFFTGTLATLTHIWHQYGIEVATRIRHGQWTVVHTTIDYFIGPNGKERYIAAPNADYHATATHRAYLPAATSAAWGRGIALVARDM